jgi:hypothetical protein
MDFVKGNYLNPRRREKLLPYRVCLLLASVWTHMLRSIGPHGVTFPQVEYEEKGVSKNVIMIAWTAALLSWILELATSTWSSGNL